ncbi:MAG: gliding motility-associated C-terminal domain-containing protein [Bacteroidales bacterium]|nr:gliding motility-associated C-terminal domain-containing protein [Bacteroidales bacterium]
MSPRMLILSALMLPPMCAVSQGEVNLSSAWWATVDSVTQQIQLQWEPSTTEQTMGYHICTGTPCTDYVSVFGRFSTSLFCSDHSVTEPHLYCLHVFDSAYNASALTPFFGNVVLRADYSVCDSSVSVEWNAYQGMPGHVESYELQALFLPNDSLFRTIYTSPDGGQFARTLTLPYNVSRVRFRVKITGHSPMVVSYSNIVDVIRRTADTAHQTSLCCAETDSLISSIKLNYVADTSYIQAPYILWRSKNGQPWQMLDVLTPNLSGRYIDRDVRPYDRQCCYVVSVKDACGMNEKRSDTLCLTLPQPDEPVVWFPNALLNDGSDNSVFRPVVRGWSGDLYELEIYNRRGNRVFSAETPDIPWNPIGQPQGTYTYRLRLRLIDGRVKTFVGTVNVIK